jgi:hypothetical protein
MISILKGIVFQVMFLIRKLFSLNDVKSELMISNGTEPDPNDNTPPPRNQTTFSNGVGTV